MKKSILAGAFATASMLSAPAMAATLAPGGTFCESQNLLASAVAATCTAGGNADFSNSISTPSELTFSGPGTLIGFVADDTGVNVNRFPDYANITLATDSIVTFNLFDTDVLFDAMFTFGTLANEVMTNTSGSVSFIATAGTYSFGVNATSPSDVRTRQESSYQLEIAAVPLPAGMVLLLTGMGGLAAVRRKRAA